MTEFSGLWTTSGTPSGDQQASYTQAQLSTAFDILAACSLFEGIAASYLNEIAPTDGGSETVNINTGGAIVDGKHYNNDASVPVNIPAAVGGGNTRIDRIVLRASWSGFTVRITRIAGTDAASPVVPSITQTPGSTYDIHLCQVLVDTGGDVTVTDERDWAVVAVDDITLENNAGTLRVKALGIDTNELAADSVVNSKIGPLAVDTTEIAADAITQAKIAPLAVDTTEIAADAITAAKIANDQLNSEHYVAGSIDAEHLAPDIIDETKLQDNSINSEHYNDGSIDLAHLAANSVDDTKVGNRVPMLTRRQGGSTTNWDQSGTSNYTPDTVKIQMGVISLGSISGSGSASQAVTFPQAFASGTKPFMMLYAAGGPAWMIADQTTLSETGITITARNLDTGLHICVVGWIAIGKE